MRLSLFVLVSSFVFLGCGGAQSQAAIVAGLTGSAVNGKSLYEGASPATCASCHQANGTGFPPTYPALQPSSKSWTVEQLAERILNGEDAMPAYKTSLTNQQVADVVAYLKATFGT